MTTERLPSRSDFEALRTQNAVYVDKTDCVVELAAGTSDRLFLARPPLFGKSLLISTFESLFSHGVREFSGLKIAPLWTDKTYPVIRLDFSFASQFEDFAEFKERFETHLNESFARASFVYDQSLPTGLLSQVSNWLHAQPIGSIVLLVDAYDAPLLTCIDRPSLFEEVQRLIDQCFSRIKREDRAFRFVFAIGVTKLGLHSSSFNHLQDLSLNPRFSSLLGFTRDDIETAFAPALERAAKIVNLSVDALLDRMADHYGGYAFDTHATSKVFCPWLVKAFLLNPEQGFKDWRNTREWSSGLKKVLSAYLSEASKREAKDKTVFLNELKMGFSLDELNLDVLLTQLGLLSIQRSDVVQVQLGVPNKATASSCARLSDWKP